MIPMATRKVPERKPNLKSLVVVLTCQLDYNLTMQMRQTMVVKMIELSHGVTKSWHHPTNLQSHPGDPDGHHGGF